ncbi:hypothetical protein [uncultured Tenacibaculum sp.]|uniref:hypothetical protein n=1 Tax=uncultured Tenacibaculum sp. TaxID=174713 RepID=UPI0026330F35|nr:hypothetical protein [uncultured Tenacibaculum sp.]
MKKIILLFILGLVTIACNSDDNTLNSEYEFVTPYTTNITVGGIIGTTERTFEVGEIFSGIDQNQNTITIRIAEPSELNNDCPNSWCYQELLEVPREFLRHLE